MENLSAAGASGHRRRLCTMTQRQRGGRRESTVPPAVATGCRSCSDLTRTSASPPGVLRVVSAFAPPWFLIACGIDLLVVPENPWRLQSLTFSPSTINLNRCRVPIDVPPEAVVVTHITHLGQ